MWVQSRYHTKPSPGTAPLVDGDYYWYTDLFASSTPPQPGSPYQLLAFGGNNFQRKVGRITALGTGSTVVTGVGFQPDVVLFATNRLYSQYRDTGVGWYPDPTGAASGTPSGKGIYPDGEMYWGAADAFGNQWSGGFWTLFYYAWYRWGYWNENACFGVGDPTGFTEHTQVPAECVLDSMDADGFTLTHDAGLDGWPNLYYMALQSSTCAMKVGTFQQPAATGNQDITGLGFDPSAVWLTSAQKYVATDAWQDDAEVQFGLLAADGGEMVTSYGYIGGNRYNAGVSHSDNATVWSMNNWLLGGKAAGSFITDGFRLNWSDTDGGARRHGYVAFETDEAYDSTPPAALLSQGASGLRAFESYGPYGTGSVTVGFADQALFGYSVGAVLGDGTFWSASRSNSMASNAVISLPAPTFPWALANLYVNVPPPASFTPSIYRYVLW